MSKKNEIAGLVTGLVAVVAAACFFLIGFLSPGSWSYAWLIFLAIPVAAIAMDIITKNKDITGSVVGFIAVLAGVTYFVLGFVVGVWHPSWLVFLAIPISAIILDMTKKKDIPGSIIGLIAMFAVIAFMLMGTYLNIWNIAWIVFLLIPITAIIFNIVKVAKQDVEEKPESGKADDFKG